MDLFDTFFKEEDEEEGDNFTFLNQSNNQYNPRGIEKKNSSNQNRQSYQNHLSESLMSSMGNQNQNFNGFSSQFENDFMQNLNSNNNKPSNNTDFNYMNFEARGDDEESIIGQSQMSDCLSFLQEPNVYQNTIQNQNKRPSIKVEQMEHQLRDFEDMFNQNQINKNVQMLNKRNNSNKKKKKSPARNHNFFASQNETIIETQEEQVSSPNYMENKRKAEMAESIYFNNNQPSYDFFSEPNVFSDNNMNNKRAKVVHHRLKDITNESLNIPNEKLNPRNNIPVQGTEFYSQNQSDHQKHNQNINMNNQRRQESQNSSMINNNNEKINMQRQVRKQDNKGIRHAQTNNKELLQENQGKNTTPNNNNNPPIITKLEKEKILNEYKHQYNKLFLTYNDKKEKSKIISNPMKLYEKLYSKTEDFKKRIPELMEKYLELYKKNIEFYYSFIYINDSSIDEILGNYENKIEEIKEKYKFD